MFLVEGNRREVKIVFKVLILYFACVHVKFVEIVTNQKVEKSKFHQDREVLLEAC